MLHCIVVARKQRGLALILMFFVLSIVAVAFFVENLGTKSIELERENITTKTLATAKSALLGFAVQANLDTLSLPNPDLRLTSATPEGEQSGSSGAIDISLIGKLPWYSLGLDMPKDDGSECLWYVVSGRFKSNPATTVLNWDTQGQIDVRDAAGNVLATNLAALIVSPGRVVDGQNRSPSEIDLKCGGNYNAANYLDTPNTINVIAGVVNFFAGSTNNREASSATNKTFMQADNDYYNDRFMFVTTDDIFNPISKRPDFAMKISSLLNDPYFSSVAISGAKGTASVNCTALLAGNQSFCRNWLEMLLLTALPTPSSIQINGVASAMCTRVLIFAGKKALTQVRGSVSDKQNVANYLEGVNLTAFAVPVAASTGFSGVSGFNAVNPSLDVMRCI